MIAISSTIARRTLRRRADLIGLSEGENPNVMGGSFPSSPLATPSGNGHYALVATPEMRVLGLRIDPAPSSEGGRRTVGVSHRKNEYDRTDAQTHEHANAHVEP